MQKILGLQLLLFCVAIICKGQNIIVNEFLSYNETGLTDFEGEHSDWIEIYNNGTTEVDLIGIHLSDDLNDLDKWTFPSIVLAPGEFLVVYASGKDGFIDGEIHTNFSIKSGGEDIVLSNANGAILSGVNAVALFPDQSFGRQTEGSTNWKTFIVPSPAAPNQTGVAGGDNPGLYLNEYMSVNVSSVKDYQGNSQDWIELYNPDTVEVPVDSMYHILSIVSTKIGLKQRGKILEVLGLENTQIQTVKMFDLAGKNVNLNQLIWINDRLQLNCQNLIDGLYLIYIQSKEQGYVLKVFLKE